MSTSATSWEGQELAGYVQNVEGLYERHEALRTSKSNDTMKAIRLRSLYRDARDAYLEANEVPATVARGFTDTLIANLVSADIAEWAAAAAV